MRISTNTIFEQGIAGIQQQQSNVFKTQQQVSSGRRMLSPSDDPVAAAHALEVSQSLAANDQYGVNRNSAKNSLALGEIALNNVTMLIQDAKVLTLNAGNPTLNSSDRASIASELRGRYQELLGLANSTDGNGQYLFSGYKGLTQPYSQLASGSVSYSGDQGQRMIQISPSRQLAISDQGEDVFRHKTGNGTFTTATAAGNTGTGVINPGKVVDLAKWDSSSRDYKIVFITSTTYDIQTAAGASVIGGVPRTYSSGTTISLKSQGAEPAFDFGVEVSIEGTPAAGDTFTIKASTSYSLLDTINDLATVLEASSGGASLTNSLSTALQNLDNALDNVLKVRASVGARLNEVDSAQSAGEDLSLQYQDALSSLQDLDYTKAISELNRQQMSLEAAQKSFLRISDLTLFNYL